MKPPTLQHIHMVMQSMQARRLMLNMRVQGEEKRVLPMFGQGLQVLLLRPLILQNSLLQLRL